MTLTRAESIDAEVGARIRARRRELRLSQSKLGDALGITFQQIQKNERGTNRVSASALIVIAETLQCHPSELLGVSETAPALDWSRFHDHETHALLEAFAGIASAKTRRAVLELLRTLGGA